MVVDRAKYMSLSEVKRLRKVTEQDALDDIKEHRVTAVARWMLVDLALSTGLRVSEITEITLADIHLERGSIRVARMKKKHKKYETLAISDDLVQHLRYFIAWQGKSEGPLFQGQRGPLTAAGLQQMWKSAIKRAGLPDELSIHSARHTLAVHLLKKTGNLRQVQKQLGHASPTITANMYADVTFEDMQDGLNGIYD